MWIIQNSDSYLSSIQYVVYVLQKLLQLQLCVTENKHSWCIFCSCFLQNHLFHGSGQFILSLVSQVSISTIEGIVLMSLHDHIWLSVWHSQGHNAVNLLICLPSMCHLEVLLPLKYAIQFTNLHLEDPIASHKSGQLCEWLPATASNTHQQCIAKWLSYDATDAQYMLSSICKKDQ